MVEVRAVNRATLTSSVDQAAWATTNFALVALMAHTLTTEEFGAFSVPLAVMILMAGLGIATSAEVLAVSRGVAIRGNESAQAASRLADDTRRTLGMTLMFAGLVPLVAAIAIFIGGAARVTPSAWWLVAASPLNQLAEGVRAILYAQRRVGGAVGTSAAWLTTQATVLFLGWGLLGLSASVVLASWACGALAAVVVGSLTLRARPSWGAATSDDRRRRWAFGIEYLATAGPVQLLTILAAPSLGLAQTGFLRALQTVYGPLNIAIMGLRNALVPAAAEEKQARVLWSLAVKASALALFVTALMTTVLLLCPGLGVALMGDSWPQDPALLAGFALGRFATAAIFGALIVFRATDASHLSTPLRLVTAALFLVPFVAGSRWGLASALWASGVGSVVAAAAWWGTAAAGRLLDER